ncbi:hypothetical protein BEP19_13845 [Ammoniphilus oxalaticus]|uniref:NlpC/P60 domain-containing protein n=1 Tax=Ammoniphilus oxalaticus TaxID=66863 RepID=A0A419SEX7_9BACL|nr:hypothetical protein BEP19_13845 [Ammoniphilus oxalaticus]
MKWDANKRKLSLVAPTLLSTDEGQKSASIQSSGNVNGAEVIRFAERFLGTPYEFGADDYRETKAFDCSSFVKYVLERFGVEVPRSSIEQASVGRRISADQFKPGDLLFFFTPGRYASNRMVGHVAMYAGNGEIIHTYGDPGVTKSELAGYWEQRLLFAKRP